MLNHHRKTVIAGNWKMYKTQAEAKSFLLRFLPQLQTDRVWWEGNPEPQNIPDVVLCVPFTNLAYVSDKLAFAPRNVKTGAQNIHWAKEGAFTGEISGAMLSEFGASYAIVGHSERRQFFGETNEAVNKRLKAAQANGITPILCVGETKEQRALGQTEAHIASQLQEGLEGVERSPLVIAYEPIWAIGTGDTCAAQEANRILAFIRQVAQAPQISLLYGGSVKPENIDELMTQPEIDGVLVGGASLDPDCFARIVNFR